MIRISNLAVAIVTAAMALSATPGNAAMTPEVKCEVGQLKATASYASCRLKTEAKALSDMVTPDFTRCEEKFNTKFPKYEENAGPLVCLSEGDLGEVRGLSDDYESQVALILGGGTLPTAQCGDGIVDLGEACDVGDLDGETCATQGFFNGTLLCEPGCTFDTSGCNATRFEDIGTTILDHQTGLEWEKKDSLGGGANLANAHDADNTYTWTTGMGGTTQSGTLYSDFLVKLNGTVDDPTKTTLNCFAGHCDWRIPTVDELKSILNAGCGAAPCIVDPVLLPNPSGQYWTNSTRAAAITGAYVITFAVSATPITADFKTALHFARGVRTQP